jgi:hypothetical protein
MPPRLGLQGIPLDGRHVTKSVVEFRDGDP